MKPLTNLIGGLAGAVALNILNETVKRLVHDAPHIDLVGEQAVIKITRKAGMAPPAGESLFIAAIAGDLISNTIYYSLIGRGNGSNIMLKGLGYGLGAGLGALAATAPMGLDDVPITKTETTKILTVAWYVLGGVVAAATIKALKK